VEVIAKVVIPAFLKPVSRGCSQN